jgi:hypothetical protein
MNVNIDRTIRPKGPGAAAPAANTKDSQQGMEGKHMDSNQTNPDEGSIENQHTSNI